MPIDGGPAFPSSNPEIGTDGGMSLRDWFAGQAIGGYLAAHSSDKEWLPTPEATSEWCYAAADAMIAERAKRLDKPAGKD